MARVWVAVLFALLAVSPVFSQTQTATASITPSITPTSSVTGSNSPTSSVTGSNSPTSSVTGSNSPTSSVTGSNSPTSSVTSSITPTSSVTSSITPTSSVTSSNSPTSSVTSSITPSTSLSGSNSASTSLSSSNSPSRSITPSTSVSSSNSPTSSVTSSITPTSSVTSSNSPTSSVTSSNTPSTSLSGSNSASTSLSSSNTPSRSITPSTSVSSSITPTISLTSSITPTISLTSSNSPSTSLSSSNSATRSITPSTSLSGSNTPSTSLSSSNSLSSSVTPTISVSRSTSPSSVGTLSSSPSAVTPSPSASFVPPNIRVYDPANLNTPLVIGATLAYPTQPLSNTTMAALTVVLKNTGGSGTVTNVAVSAPFSTNYTGGVIAAGQSVTVIINLALTKDGSFSGNFTFTVGTTTQTYTLTAQVFAIYLGNGLPAGATLRFGQVSGNQPTTVAFPFSVPATTKRAPTNIVLSEIAITPVGAFSIVNPPAGGTVTITPGNSYVLNIKFTPPNTPGIQTATLTYKLNGVAFSTPLSAYGLAAVPIVNLNGANVGISINLNGFITI